MIPPVEKRSIRPCAYMYYGCCMHYDDYNESCRIGEPAFKERDEFIILHPVSKMPLNTEENQNLFDEVNKQAAKDCPCKYNISRNEFRELIDTVESLNKEIERLEAIIEDYENREDVMP